MPQSRIRHCVRTFMKTPCAAGAPPCIKADEGRCGSCRSFVAQRGRRLVEFYVDQHNTVLPHSAFRGQTPDEIYGTGDTVPADLTARATAARSSAWRRTDRRHAGHAHQPRPHNRREPTSASRGLISLEATARTSRSPEWTWTVRTLSRIARAFHRQTLRLNDENSRAKLLNVAADTSAFHPGRIGTRSSPTTTTWRFAPGCSSRACREQCGCETTPSCDVGADGVSSSNASAADRDRCSAVPHPPRLMVGASSTAMRVCDRPRIPQRSHRAAGRDVVRKILYLRQ